MATTFLLLLFAGKLQAVLTLRSVRLRRWAPAVVTVGDNVSVRFRVSNRSRIACPWLLIEDRYAETDWLRDAAEPAPVSPPPRGFAEVEYSFVPVRRGRYLPEGVAVFAGDSLGISWQSMLFPVPGEPMLVLPKPEPVPLDLRSVVGWGVEDSEAGLSEGGGIEPRGVREYRRGDSLRYVHWRSSARHRALLVKHFEAGGLSEVTLVLDTHVLHPPARTDPLLEQAIRNSAFVARELVSLGVAIRLVGSGIEGPCTEARRGKRHYLQILEALAVVKPQVGTELQEFLGRTGSWLSPNSAFFLFTSDLRGASEAVSLLGAACATVYVYGPSEESRPWIEELKRKGTTVVPVAPPDAGRHR